MLKQILERLAILWNMANPVYLDFLKRQTRSITPPLNLNTEEFRSVQETKPKKMATVLQDDPLDIFPTDDPDQQDGNISSLTSENND